MSFLASLRALSPMARRLVAMRFFVYLGVQCCYFIGVVGTLTYAMGGGVGENVLGIGILNLCMIAGSFVGGPLLDRIGPRRYFVFVVAGLAISALAFQVLAATFWGVMAGAALFGVAWGFGDMIAKAFPSYLTNVPAELKNINSVIFTVSNVAVVAGPVAGGALAAAVSTQAVFLLLAGCALVSLVPALGFRALREPRRSEPRGKGADGSVLSSGFATVSSTPALALLFWSCFVSFFGYGAFDPLESLYYRDVLHVGVSWMGWLSAAAGLGGIVGSLLVLRIPARHVTIRTLLAVLASEGLFCLVYVGTAEPAVACLGQALLGVAFGALMPLLTTLTQMHSPLEVLGSVNAVMSFGNNMAGAVPLVCAPALARVFGVQGTLLAASSLVLAMPLVVSVVRRRRIADLVSEERALAERGAATGEGEARRA